MVEARKVVAKRLVKVLVPAPEIAMVVVPPLEVTVTPPPVKSHAVVLVLEVM